MIKKTITAHDEQELFEKLGIKELLDISHLEDDTMSLEDIVEREMQFDTEKVLNGYFFKTLKKKRAGKCKIMNIPTKQARKMKRIYELIDSDGQILGKADFKNDAIKLAKEFVEKNKDTIGSEVKYYCRISKIVIEGEANAFSFEYVENKEPATYTYKCFLV